MQLINTVKLTRTNDPCITRHQSQLDERVAFIKRACASPADDSCRYFNLSTISAMLDETLFENFGKTAVLPNGDWDEQRTSSLDAAATGIFHDFQMRPNSQSSPAATYVIAPCPISIAGLPVSNARSFSILNSPLPISPGPSP